MFIIAYSLILGYLIMKYILPGYLITQFLILGSGISNATAYVTVISTSDPNLYCEISDPSSKFQISNILLYNSSLPK